MNIIVNGAQGHMGKILIERINRQDDLNLIGEFDPVANPMATSLLPDCDNRIVIDFSHPDATEALLEVCVENNLPLVIATTGQTPEQKALIEEASKKIPLLISGNMSLGIALLSGLVSKAASTFPMGDIEIVETHHTRKADAPSGTALLLAESAKRARPELEINLGRKGMRKREKNEIGINSVRRGNIVGIHEVMLSTDSETITLKHEAHDRGLFADGAIAAARFLLDKAPGLYSIYNLEEQEKESKCEQSCCSKESQEHSKLPIRVAIVGYGNLGQGVKVAVKQARDMELVGIFSRRLDPSESGKTPSHNLPQSKAGTPMFPYTELLNQRESIDVVVNCGGSATDLPWMTPEIARNFNVVDSFDTHANILEHASNVGDVAEEAGTTAVISAGWDPGLFSLSRLYANAALPQGQDYTFWGRGVSQGHSDAIRRVEGVVDARQYTVPIQAALDQVLAGENPILTTGDKHLRECYVVAEEGADKERIEQEIKTMPNYFDEYETVVNFITMEDLMKNHSGLPHGGQVIRTGKTGLSGEFKNTIQYSLELDSNPYFTGSVLCACARAAYRMNATGLTGCKTLFDIPPAMLLPESREEIIGHLL